MKFSRKLPQLMFALSLLHLMSCSIFQDPQPYLSPEENSLPGPVVKNEGDEDELLNFGGQELPGGEVVKDTETVALEDPPPLLPEMPVSMVPEAVLAEDSKKVAYYEAKEDETLMLVAFKIYGDYKKWRELSALNPTIQTAQKVSKGSKIKYFAPEVPFVWNPQGTPYLIRVGDTLGKISASVYGHSNKWRTLWENNRPMIVDPNLIFAGFTLYYLEEKNHLAFD